MARGYIVEGFNDDAIASDDDLIERREVVEMDVLGGVGPTQSGGIVKVVAGFYGEVVRLQGLVVVYIRRHVVDHGLGPTGIVDLVDDEPTIAATAPTPVEVEEVVVVIAIAHESVAAAIAETGIVDRPTNVELILEHVLPVGERILVAVL